MSVEEQSRLHSANSDSDSGGSVTGASNDANRGEPDPDPEQYVPQDWTVGTAAFTRVQGGNPVDKGGMFSPGDTAGMLLGADPAFAPSTGHLDATVLAVAMLLLLQPSCKSRGALQYFGQNGGTVFFTTTSQAVVSDLAQLRAQRAAGVQEQDEASLSRMDKLLRLILQLQDMWKSKFEGITTEFLMEPAYQLAETKAKYSATAAANLENNASMQSGTFAVLRDNSSMISVRSENLTNGIISLRLGVDSTCDPSTEAVSLMDRLLNTPDQPPNAGIGLDGQEGSSSSDGNLSSGSSSSSGTSSGDFEDEGDEGDGGDDGEGDGGDGDGGRPAKRHRTD